MKRCTGAHLPNRAAQRVDSRHQQVRPTVKQVHCKEERSTRNSIAPIVRHVGSMPDVGHRRNALRGWARIERKGRITVLRPSRRALRALLRMRYTFDKIKKIPHPEEAARAAVSKDALRRSSRLGILVQPLRFSALRLLA